MADKELIPSSLIQFNHLETATNASNIFVSDFCINNSEHIIINIKYKINGDEKEFFELINLEELIKYN